MSPAQPTATNRPADATARRAGPGVAVPARDVSPSGVKVAGLVGRVAELDQLAAVLEAVAGGRAMTVLVGGEAGVGKSRLVEEFCDTARLAGAIVATGVCTPAGGRLPYAPVMGILRDLSRQVATDHGVLATLRASGTADPGNLYAQLAPGGGEFARTVFFESMLNTIAGVSAQTPLLLVVEDLQWADSSSTELVDYLTRNLGDSRVMVIGTYRVEEFGREHPLTAWLGEFGRHNRVLRLPLAGLSRVEIAALIAERTGSQADPAVLDSIFNRSQGNPFYTEELIAAGDPSSLPAALHNVIMSRVDRLGDSAREVLDVIAVAGAFVDHALVERIASFEANELSLAITRAVEANVLVVDNTDHGYRFRHALLREAIHDSLLPPKRVQLHREIARALTEDTRLMSAAPTHRSVEIAGHWWEAGEWAAALAPSLEAIDAALAVSAFAEAFTCIERVLVICDRAPDDAAAAGVRRAALLERGADVAYFAGAHERAVELAVAAIEAVDADADPRAAARCYTMLGRNKWAVGDSAGVFQAYEAAVVLLPADEPSVELARLRAEQARGHMLMSRNTMGAEYAQDAIDVARRIDARDIEGHALNTLGCCRANLGLAEEGLDLVRQSLVIAEELESPDDLNRAFGNLTSILLDDGRLEDAAAVMFDGAAVGEQLWGVRLNGAAGNGVEALVRLGRYAEAESVLAELGTHALGVCAPGPWTMPTPMMIRRGRFDVAEALVATAREMTSQLNDVQQAASVLGDAAELALERGRPQDAVSLVEQALALATGSDDETLLPELCALATRSIADAAEIAIPQDRGGSNAEWRARCGELSAAVSAVEQSQLARGGQPSPRLCACVAATAAERSRLDRSDPLLWAEAVRRWEIARERYPLAYSLWREAEALVESKGSRAEATERLQRSWTIAMELEAAPLASRITALAQRGRIDLRDAEAPVRASGREVADTLGLTAREVEVLGQLAAGKSDREIGAALYISKKTVSVHVSNVLRKLAVANRVEAGKIAHAHGL
jgi:DNA-binding CsgD family transcriptional regulator